ncbi:MAG TPA: hypothetical protein VFC78_04870 [Tepidisphaeraceae bacterium]|nr:hypothetical protein [Tepidisphaeraceae bacterium]
MKWVLWLLTVVLIVIHQDFWNASQIEPLLFGFVPVELWYHALYCCLAAILMALLVSRVWPTELESAQPETPEARKAEGFAGH